MKLCAPMRAKCMGLKNFPSVIETLGNVKVNGESGIQVDLSNN